MMFSYTAKTHNTAVVASVVPFIRIVPFVITVIDIICRDPTRLIPQLCLLQAFCWQLS